MKIDRRLLPMALSVMLALSACDSRPDGILSEDEMVDLLTDMEISQGYNTTNPAGGMSSDRNALPDAVLAKYGVTRAQLDSTIAYYGRNIDEYYALYDKVEKNLKKKNGQVELNIVENDIWPYSRFAAFLPNQIGDGITFSIPADELSPGETVGWRMRLSRSEGASMTLGIEYEGGMSSMVKKAPGPNGIIEATLISDTAFVAKRIFGVMTVPENSLPLWADSIKLVKTELDSLEYYKIGQQKRVYAPSPRPRSAEKKDSVERI